MPKFSEPLIHLAIQFIRNIESHMGPIGQDKVLAMLDAFDPDLRDEMIMTLFIYGDSLPITVLLKRDPSYQTTQKINAIKAIRVASGYGLREAKDATDLADEYQHSPVELKNYEHKMQLIYDLKGTGYELC
jgi:hypothetical protein